MTHGQVAAMIAVRVPLDLESDRLLAAAIASGDGEAFSRLVDIHFARLCRIAGRFFRRRETIEDVVQEALVKAYLGIKGYRGEMPLQAWLSKIVVNACYDELRRRKARPERAASELSDDPAAFLERAGAYETRGAEEKEASLTAERILALLKPEERVVLTLTILEDFSIEEVASITGWSKVNVKVRAFRARARLKKLLAVPPKEKP
ncbi:MAG TPA: RNA polymerase sigma factor [Thermoanaerobaculia bacterium]|jgi:RNA polymerase sigma-70 factor (ECF subfamily)|nr:RNA polymerase sigma factor [Thermoanaerobaculia bacterium]